MSCADPISQFSPPSLRMYHANAILSPCRSSVDDPPFSFPLNAPHRSSSSTSPSPASSPRPVLTDILLQRHKNSPRTPLCRAPTLPSPRTCTKENRESTGSAQRCDADNGACMQPLRSFAVKTKRDNLENGTSVPSLCASACSCQAVSTTNRMQLGTLQEICDSREAVSPKVVDLQKFQNESGPFMDVVCSSPSPSSLKRKRPAKLAIPVFARLASFGKAKQFEMPANEPVSSEIVSVEAPLFGVSWKKGRRDCMEDAHAAMTNFQGKANQAFFGIFDGHGGRTAAEFSAQNLGRHIAEAIQNTNGNKECLESAMQAGYLAIDAELAEKGLDGGTCTISAYLREGHLVVANAGDCKAVLCRDGKAEALSNMHRASNAEERERIQNLGGYVDCFNGVWRVQGTLAVTRALGDTNLKKWILAEPEVRQIHIEKECEFLVLASDGLWDKVSDQEVVDCVRQVLQQGREQTNSPPRPLKALRKDNDISVMVNEDIEKYESTSSMKREACNELIHKACSRGNLDDITVMVVPLANFASSM